MIGPSRLRTRRGRTAPLRSHERFARRASAARRLARGSGLALVVSAAAWLAGLPLPLHAAAVALALAAGLLLPTRRAREGALAWISRQGGLAYETALEHPAPEAADDPYGLRGALLERAVAAEQRLEPPESPAWWLPLLALALGLLLLPAVGLRGGPGPAGLPPVGPPGAASPPASEERREDAGEVEEVGTEPSPERARGPDGAPSDATEGTAEATGDAGPPTDREALDRFVDNLRRRPPEVETPVTETRSPGRTAPAPTTPPEEGPERTGDPEEGRTGEGRPGEDGEGDEARPGGEDRPGEEEGAQDGQGEQEGDAQGAEPDPAGGDAATREGAAPEPGTGGPDGPGDERPDEEQEGPGGGAGARGTADGLAGRLDAPPAGEAEALRGRLGVGPETPGGAIRLPGEADGPLPRGEAGAAYRRELERAVTEGRIPVEYQEIIRNYFR